MKSQKPESVTHGAGLQLKENQTRPELNKRAHNLLHEAIGHDTKCKDCDYYNTPDFHAKPVKLQLFKKVMFKSHNKNEQLPDFYAKPELWLCRNLTCFDLHPVFLEKDVLVEREHYQKEIKKLQDTTVPHEEYQAVLGRADRAEARAEAAEADVKTLLEQNKVLAEAAEKGGTVFVPVYHQLRLKEAEARIVELEKELKK